MEKKKAISDIVSTVLIIMIAVAAVGIIGAIIVPMVRNSLDGSTACLAVVRDIEISGVDSCYNVGNDTTNSSARIVIRRSTGDYDLVELTIQAIDNQGTSTSRKINETDEILTPGASKAYIVNATDKSTIFTAASWSAKVDVGNTRQSCGDASASKVSIQECK